MEAAARTSRRASPNLTEVVADLRRAVAARAHPAAQEARKRASTTTAISQVIGRKCRTRIKDEDEKGKQGQAHLVRDGDEHHEGLMMATVTMGVMTSIVAPQQVHLNEQKVYPESTPPGVWYFDIGATSHMKGERGMFTTLDESVQGSVKFGDGSHVAIRGRGSVIFRGQSGNQRALSEVYFIPSLNSNIISVGQLDEGGCKIEIHEGLMMIYDPGRRMMARVRRSHSRLYTAALTIDAPICLLTKSDDETWRWHARMEHLHFRALCVGTNPVQR